jgi:tetratricopeptide (TPR) repeat protein
MGRKTESQRMQKEHVAKAQELAMQAATSAQDSAAAAVLLGQVQWDAERPREAFAAFRTAMMVLTQQGLRTQQAAKVLYWLARCAMKLGRLESAKRDLRHAAGILMSIHPGGHKDLDDVHELQGELYIELKQHRRAARTLEPLAGRLHGTGISTQRLRLRTMLSVAFGGLESWREAARELGNAAAEAVLLCDALRGAGACSHMLADAKKVPL